MIDSEALDHLEVRESPSLGVLTALALTSVGSLSLRDLPDLANVASAFPALTVITDWLSVERCPNVTSAEIAALAAAAAPGATIEHCGNADDDPC
jgi:hypothetical protein